MLKLKFNFALHLICEPEVKFVLFLRIRGVVCKAPRAFDKRPLVVSTSLKNSYSTRAIINCERTLRVVKTFCMKRSRDYTILILTVFPICTYFALFFIYGQCSDVDLLGIFFWFKVSVPVVGVFWVQSDLNADIILHFILALSPSLFPVKRKLKLHIEFVFIVIATPNSWFG